MDESAVVEDEAPKASSSRATLTSRRSQSDGSAAITSSDPANQNVAVDATSSLPTNGTSRPVVTSSTPTNDRRRSHSACDDRANQLKARIDARFEQFDREMQRKRQSCGLNGEASNSLNLSGLQSTSCSDHAVIHLDQLTPNDCDTSILPPGTTVFKSVSPACVTVQMQSPTGSAARDGLSLADTPLTSRTNGVKTSTPLVNGSMTSREGAANGIEAPTPATPPGDIALSWQPRGSMTVSEVKEIAYHRLQEEMLKLQRELQLKDEEVAKLTNIRDEVGSELEDLTASLFEEANKMVQDANIQTALAQKRLKEALLKNDGLSAEVEALKTLVITSTPSMPNPHLHPHISPRNGSGCDTRLNGNRLSPRSALHHPHSNRYHNNHHHGHYAHTNGGGSHVGIPSTGSMNELCSFSAQQQQALCCSNSGALTNDLGGDVTDHVTGGALPDYYEVDPEYHREFVTWRKEPSLEADTPFLARVYREEILPCLAFSAQDAMRVVGGAKVVPISDEA